MDSDSKSVNDKNNQDDNPPKNLKSKQKVEDLDKDSLHPQNHMEKELNLANAEGFNGRGTDDFREESSKRKRNRGSPEVIDLCSDSPVVESLKLVEEMVRICYDYIDQAFLMAKDRSRDEKSWNLHRTICNSLIESFCQKIERLDMELEEMEKDLNQRKNYCLIEPRVRQIMNQLVKMHERFDCTPDITASSLTNWKEEPIFSKDEIDRSRKELYGITWRIGELKTMKMYPKTMEITRKNLRF